MRKLILIVILALENIAVAALFLVLFRSGVFSGTADANGVAVPTVVALAASPTPTRPASPISPSPTITPAPASPTAVATATSAPPTPTASPIPSLTYTPAPPLRTAAPSNTPARAASTAVPSSPTVAPFTPTPTIGRVGNTNGLGVWLRHSPNPNDRWVAWPDNTPLVILGPEATINGERWLQVKDPAGDVGWMQARYVVGCCYTPTPKAG